MSKHKRRQYLVDKNLQIKYVLLNILLLVIFTLMFATALFIPFILGLSDNNSLAVQAKAARTLLSLHENIWPALGLTVLVLSIFSIFVSHKIAGPVYRFRKVLTEVAAGNLNITIRLRKRDELKDLADDMNVVISDLRNFVKTLQDDHLTMTKCIEELEKTSNLDAIESKEGNGLVEQLKSSAANTARALEKYRG